MREGTHKGGARLRGRVLESRKPRKDVRQDRREGEKWGRNGDRERQSEGQKDTRREAMSKKKKEGVGEKGR